ncbi:NADP-dependent 3-hydroxy acid dehydrogenase YdfG [Sinobacterium caligoides]|uniref:NADP-dependent 3-hydroxy acid dehydrogenase YdfG n=1 Tax=Sinobacterium caligoides TaxID=933926 RepID=A0A3N2E0U2_9GAMM|nr:SDR family NAD(P)-dependent oxidoreductase [Sinobacterium caligoides]ROS05522.1 NADP-dependent 3-hydroxy acid dehydrogenase YdfG [Sinobacterium caligoides]
MRTAIITGVSTGIGRSLAVNFVAQGYRVFGVSRNEDILAQLKSKLGKRFEYLAVDLVEEGSVDNVFFTAKKVFNCEPDLIIANAGRGIKGSVSTVNMQEFEEVMDLNYLSTIKLLQKSANVLKNINSDSKDIVVIGSVAGSNISPFSSAYGTSKIAIHWAAEALRRELAPEGIRVSLIIPGVVKSNFQENAGYDDNLIDSFENDFGPLISPDELAETISTIISLPSHINISEMTIRPTKQAYP